MSDTERRANLRAVDTLTPDDINRLKHIMNNFVHIGGGQHPENRLDRLEQKLDSVTTAIHEIQIGLSNAQLVQKGVLWLAGIIGSSAVVMAMTFLFKG